MHTPTCFGASASSSGSFDIVFITQRSTDLSNLIISIFCNLANAKSKLREDGAEAPKYVGAFVS